MIRRFVAWWLCRYARKIEAELQRRHDGGGDKLLSVTLHTTRTLDGVSCYWGKAHIGFYDRQEGFPSATMVCDKLSKVRAEREHDSLDERVTALEQRGKKRKRDN